MSGDSNNNEDAIGGDSASVYYSAASSDNDSDRQEEVVTEQVNFEGRRDNQRQEYRRRLTLDPLTDFLVNGDMLLEEAGSDVDTSGDEQQHDDVNEQPNIERDPERDAVRQQLLVLLGQAIRGGDDGSSSSDDDAYSQLNQNDENENADDVSHLLARDHAYLPTAQPLYPEEWIPAGRHRNRLHQSSGSSDNMSQPSIESADNNLNFNVGAENEAEWSSHYEIQEPSDGQIAAPTQRSLHEDEKIEVHHTKNVLAVMEVDDVVLFPGSTIPLRVRDPIWMNYLGTLIDDARGLYGSHSGTARGMGEVQIGILPRISNRTRRRAQARRSSSASSEPTGGDRMGRWRIDLIRRGVAATRRPSRRRRTDDRDRMSTNSADDDGDNAGSSHDASSMARERGSVRREESEDESEEGEYFRPSVSAPSSSNPYVGRVGTFATITFTHEEAATDAVDETTGTGSANEQERSRSRVWQRHRGEIVVTALGTSRFRIISPVDIDANPEYQDRRYDGFLFEVEEMNHSGPAMPPEWMLRSPGDFRYPIVTQSNSHANAIWHLAHRSSSPAVAYHSVWPWRIAQKICDLIDQTEQFRGIKKILPSAGGLVQLKDTFHGAPQFRVVDPSAFADWLSSNLPLSQNERLDLLEMECRVSQLKQLLKNVEKDRETIIRCKCCSSALSPMRNIFTVKGAEGTTGNYINEHGIVHQTVTLREVDPKVSVVCVGRPETKDSWFPGYSWQIAYCYVCSSHLGWRFRRVNKSDDTEDPERPAKFWGFSYSSITTESAVAPRRVVFNRDSTARRRAFVLLGGD